ncbi:MAG: hypothetical protein IT580_11905 [Verrucomicrobiales bacterium]|nr:hypothetical protein [Verrucomicrobiales bacterium]
MPADATLDPAGSSLLDGTASGPAVAWRRAGVLLLAGFNLTLVQFLAMREIAALVGSNELVVMFVAGGYFVGLSAGYLVSERLSPATLAGLGVGSLLWHATTPFSVRAAAAWMISAGHSELVPPFLGLLVVIGFGAFYAVFLPRLIEAHPDRVASPQRAMARCYATELVGGALGLLVILVVTPARMSWIATMHLAGLALLLGLLLRVAAGGKVLLAAVPVAYVLVWPTADRASLEAHFRAAHRWAESRVLASEFSPYQRVDIVEARSRPGGGWSTNLYLNGNLLYGTRGLHRHNLMVAVMPNLMRPPGERRALVIAGGSLDNARYLAPQVDQLHVVEIDEAVVRLSRRFLQEPRGQFPTNWSLVIDDGKHFLGTWQGEPFDTIAVDVPVPTHLQTAMLHSERFFALAKSRLRPGGVFSISLAGRLDARRPGTNSASGRLAERIAAGLARQFEHVTVARLGGSDFAWASDRPLGQDLRALQAVADRFVATQPEGRQRFGQPRLKVLSPGLVSRQVAQVDPIREADMQLVLRLSLNKLKRRFYSDDPHLEKPEGHGEGKSGHSHDGHEASDHESGDHDEEP